MINLKQQYISLFSNKLWIEDEHHNLEKLKQVVEATHQNIPQRNRSDSGPQNSSTTVDEETVTEWIPEIPFENVRRLLKYCHITS